MVAYLPMHLLLFSIIGTLPEERDLSKEMIVILNITPVVRGAQGMIKIADTLRKYQGIHLYLKSYVN